LIEAFGLFVFGVDDNGHHADAVSSPKKPVEGVHEEMLTQSQSASP